MKKREIMVILITALIVASLLVPRAEGYDGMYDTVSVRTIEEKIEAIGMVQHEKLYPVAPVTAGSLRLFVEEGEYVREGQALFEVKNAGLDELDALIGQSGQDIDAGTLYKANTGLSPANGYIVSLEGYDGMTVGAGTPVIVIASREISVQFMLPQAKREYVQEGQAIQVTRNASTMSGKISSILPSETQQGQYLVRASVPAWSAVEPGMQVDVSITLNSITAPSVPIEAVEGGFVTCIIDGRLKKVAVKTGLYNEMYVALLYGPETGTKVKLSGGA